jgi:hypothetical protein
MPQRDGSGIAFVRPKDFVHAAYGLSPVLRVMVRSGAEKRILPLLSKFPHHIFRVRGSDKPSRRLAPSSASRAHGTRSPSGGLGLSGGGTGGEKGLWNSYPR